MVADYNLLMKDLPLNELMSAMDFESIRSALVNVFTHLKKVRNTKYPIIRAHKLITAISRDLYGQLIKVQFESIICNKNF